MIIKTVEGQKHKITHTLLLCPGKFSIITQSIALMKGKSGPCARFINNITQMLYFGSKTTLICNNWLKGLGLGQLVKSKQFVRSKPKEYHYILIITKQHISSCSPYIVVHKKWCCINHVFSNSHLFRELWFLASTSVSILWIINIYKIFPGS